MGDEVTLIRATNQTASGSSSGIRAVVVAEVAAVATCIAHAPETKQKEVQAAASVCVVVVAALFFLCCSPHLIALAFFSHSLSPSPDVAKIYGDQEDPSTPSPIR